MSTQRKSSSVESVSQWESIPIILSGNKRSVGYGASHSVINQHGTLRKSSVRGSTGTREAYGSSPSSAREGKRKIVG